MNARKPLADYGHEIDVPEGAYPALVRAWFSSRDPAETSSVTSERTTAYAHSVVACHVHDRIPRVSNDPDKADAYFENAVELE